MRLTAIDIGTNTILMLIADVDAGGVISPVRDEQVIARLGKGVDANRRITADTSNRVLGYLRDYKAVAESLGSESIVACGTSALRDASNSQEFVAFVQAKLGLKISVLSGEEEAELTFCGAASEFSGSDADEPLAVLDIGGGSTELTMGKHGVVVNRVSLDLGCVRLTERIFRTSPPSFQSLDLAVQEVQSLTSALPHIPTGTRLIGVAGTVTTVAAIDLRLKTYDRLRISGHVLALKTIEGIFNHLKTCNLEQMAQDFPQIEAGRKDIILAGVLILIESLRHLDVESITVSDRGLRYGIALGEYARLADKS